ncbi:MAG: DNA polymerase III subunit gamma/tau [Bradymonadia bacterium]
MSYLVLARKWRPTTFDDVVGQGHVTQTLKNAIERDRVAHALLFTGSRGIGKTSCARILAKALNCVKGPTPNPCGECPSCVEITGGHSVDVFEIDGASNNSVEQIREIRESVKFLPTHGKKKMYIIDEVHMLSTGAFNALLKTLEEPPAHVTFVLATTEPHKIPETILSRCQRFDFKRIPERAIAEALQRITEAEGVSVEMPALHQIAREAEGGMRDSLSLLDQVISFCGTEITTQQVREVLGVADRGLLHTLVGALIAADGRAALQIIDELFQFGIDLQKFTGELLKYIRDLMVVRICDDAPRLVDQTEDEIDHMRQLVGEIDPARIHRLFNALLKGAEEISRSPYPKLVLEMTTLRICHQGATLPLADVLKGLERLESRLDEMPEGGGSHSGGSHSGGSHGGTAGGGAHGGPTGALGMQAHALEPQAPTPERPAPERSAPQATPAPLPTPAPSANAVAAVNEESEISAFDRVAALVDQGVPAPESPPESPAPYNHGPVESASQAADVAPVPMTPPPEASVEPVPAAPDGSASAPATHTAAADVAVDAAEDDSWPDPADSVPWTLPEIPIPEANDPTPWPPTTGPLALVAARKAGWIAPAEASEAPAASEGSALEALAAEVGFTINRDAIGPVKPRTFTLERPDPADLPVIPDRPDAADGPIDWQAEQDQLARLQQLIVRLRRGPHRQRVEFLGIHLEANGHIVTFDPHALELAVPQAEFPTLEPHVEALQTAVNDAAGHDLLLTLTPCAPGDQRLAAETLRTRSLRILEERSEARSAHARAHDRVIDALEVFGGEITLVTPHGP